MTTSYSMNELLREIRDGKNQLPDFQRGWVWDDDHIRDLLPSHAPATALLRNDDFDSFVEDRRRRLVALSERTMGKQVNLAREKEEYELYERRCLTIERLLQTQDRKHKQRRRS